MKTAYAVMFIIMAAGILVGLLAMVIATSNPDIKKPWTGNGLPKTKADIKKLKRQYRKKPLIATIVFVVVMLVILAIMYATPRVSTWYSERKAAKTEQDATNNENPEDTNQEDSQSPADAAPEGENPEEAAEAEDASEDAGETENGLTAEEIQANTETLRANVAASAIASTHEFTEGLKASATENAADAEEQSEEEVAADTETESEPAAELAQSGTTAATAIRERVAAETVSTFTIFTALLTPDTSGYVYPNMDKAELAGKYDALINYGGVTHTALTSKRMDRVKKFMAELYGLGRCGDMLGLPPETLDEWSWLYQLAGAHPVTAADLKGLDLEDDAVVKGLLEAKKKEVWDPRWEAMDEQQRAAQTLLATEVAILNNPIFCRAYLMHYSEISFVYKAGKKDMDNMLGLYDGAYDTEGVDKETEPYGLLCFVEKITQEQFDRGEVWLAPVNQMFIEEIGSHVCELLLSVDYEGTGFKKLTSSRNWCLPMTTSDVLREPVEAEYQESREALIREQYDKDDLVMLRDGINRYDLRPERFPINTTAKKPPVTTKTNPLLLHIEYRYDSITGPEVDTPHKSHHNAGDDFRVPSPQRDGYTAKIELVEGYSGTLDNPMLIAGTMSNSNVHIIVVYRKPASNNNNTNNESHEGGTPEGGNPEGGNPEGGNPPGDDTTPEDGEGAKVSSADAVYNNNANYIGGTQESGLDGKQNINTELAPTENYGEGEGTGEGEGEGAGEGEGEGEGGDTIHESELTPPPKKEEVKVDPVIEVKEIKTENNEVIIVEKEVDVSKEENKGKLVLDD